MSRIIKKLDQAWNFAIDPHDIGIQQLWHQTGLLESKEVKIPHTFNIESETVDYRGTSWYEYRFTPEQLWEGKKVRIQFNGVYRDADIWLNGKLIGQHYHSGYTTFTIDTKDTCRVGIENRLMVKVKNNFSGESLPYERSFDWADDGGIFREVSFIITGKLAFDYVKIDAKPMIPSYGKYNSHSKAIWKADVILCQNAPQNSNRSCKVEIYEGIDASKKLIHTSEEIKIDKSEYFRLPEIKFDKVALWHFDFPALYTAIITLKENNIISDQVSIQFGFREFLSENHRFLLNGEYVRLCGTEWMPGSNPAYGNAEPKEYLAKTLKQLKETNCIFTRFHWQQDEAVYEWCDQNGILIQEEIPHWGKVSKMPGELEMAVSKQQIDEMMASHFNHPSIVMWGMGNELCGQTAEIHDFVLELKDYIKSVDQTRMVNYITNTIYENPSNDATSKGDILMVNDYIGTWHGDLDTADELHKVIAANPKRLLVISEFGLCEPTHQGGDLRRCQIFMEKMKVYSKFPQIGGIINFCLNDYRTQIGEEGSHHLKRRVHGSTDIFGEPKPSYYLVRNYCSPIQIMNIVAGAEEFFIRLLAKNELPSYTICNYQIIFWNKDRIVEQRKIVPLLPGEQCDMKLSNQVNRIQIFRPNGFLVEDRYI